MTSRLEQALKRLPENLQDEVADFAEFLIDKHPSTERASVSTAAEGQGKPQEEHRRLKMDWAGKLPPKFPGETGVDLAHEALQYRMSEAERDSRGE